MTIQGIGVDIVEIERVARVLKLYPKRFPQRILHEDEYATYQKQKNPAAYLARCFAAKEAISKALSKGFRKGCYARQLLIERDELGKPIAKLPQHIKAHVEVSLSDEKHYAVAMALAVKTDS